VDESDEDNNCEVNFVDCPPCKPDLIVTDINAYHYNTNTPPWFNMQNEINVTVKNNGSAAAGASTVCLYIDNVPFGDLPVSSLEVNEEVTVMFTGWNPSGDDCLQQPCNYEDSFQDYDVKAVADCDGDVAESNETNNETRMRRTMRQR
jgi:subtilase family serine protease